MYTEKSIVRIAKRENNKKRNYLVVNRLQGKHIPVSPNESLNMFHALAEQIKGAYTGEKILFIGFAETATAIGGAVAAEFDAYYMQTTREMIPDEEYLYFSEEHSHATEQKLVRSYLDKVAAYTDRIIFVEDEVTTGKTILNIIRILEKEYPQIQSYSVASILNGMDEDALNNYKEKGIDLFYLVKTNHAGYGKIADKYAGDGRYYDVCPDKADESICVRELRIGDYVNARCGLDSKEYAGYVDRLADEVLKQLNLKGVEKLLIVGTEEFMYPAIRLGGRIDSAEVYTHSTTRSPIEVSNEEDYPLHERYELRSLYDSERKTFIYDIGVYDCVIILTDADDKSETGVLSLVNALGTKNKNIYIIRWC